jgi:hypothetical protein
MQIVMKLILFFYRKMCSWSICITTEKSGNQLVNMLPRFVDEVFLHPGEQDPVFRAATQAFAMPGVLDHTAIVVFHVDKLGNDIADQLTLSTPFLPWGLPLQPCKKCSTMLWVSCQGRKGPKPHEKMVTICCTMCKNWGISYRPTDAKVLQQDILDEKLYMRLTYLPGKGGGRLEWESM